jgi:uncharacterized protein YjbI with pentapeptide repeats
MATSHAALSALTESPNAWAAYRLQVSGGVDLTLAQLRGLDLRGRSLEACDLSGADLTGANLDGCKMARSSLRNASLKDASLVSCEFDSVDADGAIFQFTVLRDSKFTTVNFFGADLSSVKATRCVFRDCVFDRARMNGAFWFQCRSHGGSFADLRTNELHLAECEFLNSRWLNVVCTAANLMNCDMSSSLFRDTGFVRSKITGLVLANADVTRLTTTGSSIDGIDLSGSTLREMSLVDLDLPHATMMNTAVIRCLWPRQRPRVTWAGRYEASAHLLGHPVQDLRGLTPSLRREVADAQYLHELYNSLGNRFQAGLFRLWGTTTAFGQSLLRLSAVTAVLIVGLAGGLTLVDGMISPWPANISAATNAVAVISGSFLGIETPSSVHLNAVQKLLLLVARVSGFFVLGLWIGIAANKLGKLSSE